MEEGVPGIFKRMAEINPPEMPPMYSPTSSARPMVGSMLKVMGKNSTTAMVAERPGIEPKIMPSMVPAQIRARQAGLNTLPMATENISIFFPP